MKYKSIQVTRRGGPEALQVIENELRAPAAGEARIKVEVTHVCQDDVAARVGNRPFLPKLPFTPGYAIIGRVDQIGEGVTQVKVGERVAALIQLGGYAEYVYWKADNLAPVPESLDAAEASPLILNYLVAYQILNRVARVQAGDKVLMVGASGGCGTAFLQLGKLAGLKMYGLASARKHAILESYGAVPIDYQRQDFVTELHKAEPEGLDFVFNGMGEEYFERGLAVLRKGGVLVHYGGPQSMRGFFLLMLKLIGYNLLPNGKTIKGYGTHREGVSGFKEDWSHLFRLLEERKIEPLIAGKFPLLEAARANEMLESGQVSGSLVLLAGVDE